ncbi:MAG: M23 family metallopeptidase [Pseudomonadota bacterium]
MNIVVFSSRSRGPRQYQLTSTPVVAALLATVTVFSALIFGAGYTLAARGANLQDDASMDAMQLELVAQRELLEQARRDAQETLDALAIRIGRTNAHVVRLDALGQRLTEMAGLNEGEFDFDAEPPIGGPEETAFVDDQDEVGLLAQLQGIDQQLDSRGQQLAVLETMLLNRKVGESTTPAGHPVKGGWISSHFGTRTDPFTGKQARHKGVDIAARAGAEIMAVGSGVVTYSGNRFGYGLMVEIDHGDGYITRYAHNSENLVDVGAEVRKGQVIGLMGSTGRATGPNLHFEVLKDGKLLNPVSFIRGRKSGR